MSDDGSFFLLSRFKAKTKVQEMVVREFLHADDAVLCASSPNQQQELLDARICKKTVVLSLSSEYNFTLDDTPLENANKFSYLGSSVSANFCLDQELSMRIGKAAVTFGKLE